MAGFLAVVLACFLVGCVSTPGKDAPVRDIDAATLKIFNDIADEAASDPKRRSRSGSRSRFSVGFDAVLLYDRQNTHLIWGPLGKVARDFHHGYIDSSERFERSLQVFSERGVLPNRKYRGAEHQLLLPLEGYLTMPASSLALLEKLYSGHTFNPPALRMVKSEAAMLANNYVVSSDMAVVDPAGIRRSSEHYGFDPDLMIEAVAIHEAVHQTHNQLMKPGKFSVYKRHMKEINDDATVHYYHWREVEEFMADAVSVQANTHAPLFPLSRILHAKNAVDEPSVTRTRRPRPHDASARFAYLLLKAREEALGAEIVGDDIDWLRRERQDTFVWYDLNFQPYLKRVVDDAFITTLQTAYLAEFERIRDIVLKKN